MIMSSTKIVIKQNSASLDAIIVHLTLADKFFKPALSSYVDIAAYATKIKLNSITFEAWEENQLIGLIACYANNVKEKKAYITNVSVLSAYYNQGIASTLLDMCIDKLKQKNIESLLLEVRNNNERAIRLYGKKGFMLMEKNCMCSNRDSCKFSLNINSPT